MMAYFIDGPFAGRAFKVDRKEYFVPASFAKQLGTTASFVPTDSPLSKGLVFASMIPSTIKCLIFHGELYYCYRNEMSTYMRVANPEVEMEILAWIAGEGVGG